MKTKEELNALKEEVENLNRKLAELSEDELAQVCGGLNPLVDQKLTSASNLATGSLKPPVHEIGAYYDAEYFELP